jgi:two-component system chemotaxis response regulator CheY
MKKRILVVDDSGLARRLTRKMLEGMGHEVEEASGGAEALEQYALGKHDLVLLDLLMTGMYGIEVLHKLREMNPALPVVVVTADIQRSTRDQVKQAGAAAMVNKPIDQEELAEVLDLVWKGEGSWN